MALDPDFVRDLRCPRTGKALALLSGADLEALNARIGSGELRNRAGVVVTEPVQDALRPDGEPYVYPVRDDIPTMLSDETLPLTD